jgi:predicted transposase/invertase (TIGR01784 family)
MVKKLVRFDWAMKKILRHKANFDILEGFLSELLGEDIKIKQLLESESNKETEDDKFNRVDILVEDSKGELIIIEVQDSKEYDYFHRMLFGAAKAITEHIKTGQPYADVKKIIAITIAYFDLGQGKDYVYHGTNVFRGIHKNDILTLADKQVELYQRQQVYEIFPEYWVIKVSKFPDRVKDKLDEWIYFLKNAEVKKGFSAKGLKEAGERLEEMKLNEKEAREYKRYLKDLRDIASAQHTKMADAQDLLKAEQKGMEKGMQEGMEKGMQEGMEKGMQEGMEKGMQEGMEKGIKEGIEKGIKAGEGKKEIEAVIGLHENKIPVSIIAISLKISVERIEEIIKEYANTR